MWTQVASASLQVIMRHEGSGLMWWGGTFDVVVDLQHLESTVSCAVMIHCVVYVILGVTFYIVCHLSDLNNLFYGISKINCMNSFWIHYQVLHTLTVFLKSWDIQYAVTHLYIGKAYEMLTKCFKLRVLKFFFPAFHRSNLILSSKKIHKFL